MEKSGSLIAWASLLWTSTSAFSPSSHPLRGHCLTTSPPNRGRRARTRRLRAAATATADAGPATTADVPVARVSVCSGELCQCQGPAYEFTGGASDAALATLRSLNLPFDVDEVGCLGACGRGTMIAIDYADGGSALTDGLDATLKELGIERRGEGAAAAASLSEDASAPPAASTTAAEERMVQEKAKKPPALADARDRMRREADADEAAANPWMNMASYLAKKATDRVFGSE